MMIMMVMMVMMNDSDNPNNTMDHSVAPNDNGDSNDTANNINNTNTIEAGTVATSTTTTTSEDNNMPICITAPDVINLVVITNDNNNNNTANDSTTTTTIVNNINDCTVVNAVATSINTNNNTNNNNNNHHQTNQPVATVTAEDTEMRHRFKVVKLVSSQPYTRGRWTCFDYNDENQNTINISRHVPVNKIQPNGHAESQMNASDHNCNNGAPSNNGNAGDQSEVAIDNKIEQAMDLVKSHLMFAVREEVDVLRERIKELELDIQILRAHATPETLALLSNRTTTTMANQNQE